MTLPRVPFRATVLALVLSAALIPVHSALADQCRSGSDWYIAWGASPLLFYPFPATPARSYSLYVPTSYKAGTPIPLVVMLHGCDEDPNTFAGGTRMNQLAETENFLLLYPQEDIFYNSLRCWNWHDLSNQHYGAEAAVIAGMVDTIKSRCSVDVRRVYVAGMSAGGAMASIMASCYASVFAAAAIHSGFEYEAAINPIELSQVLTGDSGGVIDPTIAGRHAYDCSGSKRLLMPVIVIHGSNDTLVKPVNAEQVLKQFATMNDLGDDGEENDSVRSIPTSTTSGIAPVPGGRSYTVEQYNYAGQLLLEKIIVHNMHNMNTRTIDRGHAWSGGDSKYPYNDRKGPDASRFIWEFFKLHSR